MKVAQSCLTLCNPVDCTVHGILQARILEWVAIPFSRGSSQPRDSTQVSQTVGRFFASRVKLGKYALRKILYYKQMVCVHAKSLQLHLILCVPIDYSLLGASVHGILQARIVELVAMIPPGDLPDPGSNLISHVSNIGRRVLYHSSYVESPR